MGLMDFRKWFLGEYGKQPLSAEDRGRLAVRIGQLKAEIASKQQELGECEEKFVEQRIHDGRYDAAARAWNNYYKKKDTP